jgi:hypothetical protein
MINKDMGKEFSNSEFLYQKIELIKYYNKGYKMIIFSDTSESKEKNILKLKYHKNKEDLKTGLASL